MYSLVTAWETIRKEFGDHDVPSTLTGVTVLGYTNQLVEIEAVATVEKLQDESLPSESFFQAFYQLVLRLQVQSSQLLEEGFRKFPLRKTCPSLIAAFPVINGFLFRN